MTIRITTSTGSVYDLFLGSDGLVSAWRKNDGSVEKLWWAHCIPEIKDSGITSWSEINALEKLSINVGLRLYIGSRDVWWLSSAIVSIEKVDDVFTDVHGVDHPSTVEDALYRERLADDDR